MGLSANSADNLDNNKKYETKETQSRKVEGVDNIQYKLYVKNIQ